MYVIMYSFLLWIYTIYIAKEKCIKCVNIKKERKYEKREYNKKEKENRKKENVRLLFRKKKR